MHIHDYVSDIFIYENEDELLEISYMPYWFPEYWDGAIYENYEG